MWTVHWVRMCGPRAHLAGLLVHCPAPEVGRAFIHKLADRIHRRAAVESVTAHVMRIDAQKQSEL